MKSDEYLAAWLNACCRLHHKVCTPTPVAERQAHQIPSWVIDTQDGCIVPGASVPRYACLSYTWSQPLKPIQGEGSDPRNLMLNRGNLADFQRPGSLNSTFRDRVPAAVRDAMDLVLGAGERYLWVDCFCILRGSESTRTEIDRMDDIYAGAHFTIIAAAAEGLKGGTTYGRLEKKWHYLDKEMRHKLLNTTWASRGWTFQEHMFSKRTIVFLGDGQTFWDCNTDFWHQDSTQQDLETDHSYSYGYAAGKYEARGPSLSRLNWPDMELYTRIICLFNTRELSFPQDSQAALSGVMHSLSRGFFGGFINALPRLFLDSALLWQPLKGYTVRRIPRAGSGMEPNCPQHLPTWSWCGWKCAIDPRSMVFARDFEYPYRDHPWTLTQSVQWSVMSNHGEHGDDIREPAMLQKNRSYTPDTADALPSGWRITIQNNESRGTIIHTLKWFSHDALQPEDHKFAYQFNNFAYPVPLPDSENDKAQSFNTSWPFLTGSTTSANLRVRCILKPDRLTKTEKAYCETSYIVRLPAPEFTAGPDDCFSVAVLEDEHGTWAGVLRIVETYEAEQEKDGLRLGGEAELVALSKGQVPCHILLDKLGTSDLCEEQIDNRSWAEFETHEEVTQGTYTQSRIRFRREGGLENDDQDYKGGKSVYEFYNVMWVVREQGVLYRRGVGRVCRSIWDRSCSGIEKVVLG